MKLLRLTLLVIVLLLPAASRGQQPNLPSGTPKAADPRLVVELVAASPDIVHPIGIDFDAKGNLLVIESHTHFAPAGYTGPKFDRIRLLGGKGKFTTFFEGTRFTMDIAVHPDGSVYLATRNEILRLRDTKGEGKADVKERIVFLDTKGDYPHNGLSGLCFDSRGDLYFGMGENLGAFYKLIGSDGTTISGEGDGGHIFHCGADGKKLRRVATGFWNPFGVCRDIYGRIFAVDNDPDAMPPCRLLHVVEGGDYGFQFRYGRQGRHPFQAWNGELPGTLPMISGTGEAPCEVLSYESDNLPAEYLGNLLVTSWADHRVERYRLKEKGASFTAVREPFVQGGADFRPVGMAVAPDGSIYISDWVRRDYTLHGKGAIWRIRAKDAPPMKRPSDPKEAIYSLHRPLRETAARKLAMDEAGRAFLREQFNDKRVRVLAASMTALIDSGNPEPHLKIVIRGLSIRSEGQPHLPYHPALMLDEIPTFNAAGKLPVLLELFNDPDPFLRHAATWQLGQSPALLKTIDSKSLTKPRQREAWLLALRASNQPGAVKMLPNFLADPDEIVRFLAAKWIADDKLTEFRPNIAEAIKNPKLNVRMYHAYATALARLDGKQVNEDQLAEYFFERLADDSAPAAMRVLALQSVPANYGRLSVSLLEKLLAQPDEALRSEAVRTLGYHPDTRRFGPLLQMVRNSSASEEMRTQAVLGLAPNAQVHVDELLALAFKESAAMRAEALRALIGVKLSDVQQIRLKRLPAEHADSRHLVERLLTGKANAEPRAAAKDLDAWLKLLEGPADVAAGRRVFAHPKLAGCYRCHRAEGRGNVVGPDLSTIGRTERRSILESILQPSNNVAPHYQTWTIETADGKVQNGLLTGTQLDDYSYLNEKGETFRINTRNIVSIRPVPNSIMPDGLADRMTDQELRDLLAYLCSRR